MRQLVGSRGLKDLSRGFSRSELEPTALVSLDRKKHLVPNKDLTNGRLVNWILSDAINRLDITAGVAYPGYFISRLSLVFRRVWSAKTLENVNEKIKLLRAFVPNSTRRQR